MAESLTKHFHSLPDIETPEKSPTFHEQIYYNMGAGHGPGGGYDLDDFERFRPLLGGQYNNFFL